MGKASTDTGTTWSMGAVTDDFRRQRTQPGVHENETPSSRRQLASHDGAYWPR